MASLRIYFHAFIMSNIEDVKKTIIEDSSSFSEFDQHKKITQSGFYKQSGVLKSLLNDYYISDYFEIGKKTIPTIHTELSYFNLQDINAEKERRKHPFMIKVAFNPKKGILCFYTRSPLNDTVADNLLGKLRTTYGFNFKFAPFLYAFRDANLHDFVNALEITDFKAITIWDDTNKITLKHRSKISETEQYFHFIEEQSKGNWTHIKVPFEELAIQLRIHNTKAQKYLTFENKYVDDEHLTKAIEFITNKILEIEDFGGQLQASMDSFLSDI